MTIRPFDPSRLDRVSASSTLQQVCDHLTLRFGLEGFDDVARLVKLYGAEGHDVTTMMQVFMERSTSVVIDRPVPTVDNELDALFYAEDSFKVRTYRGTISKSLLDYGSLFGSSLRPDMDTAFAALFAWTMCLRRKPSLTTPAFFMTLFPFAPTLASSLYEQSYGVPLPTTRPWNGMGR